MSDASGAGLQTAHDYEARQRLARLIADNPALPVYKKCGPAEGFDDDGYVLVLDGAEVGRWWTYGCDVFWDEGALVEAIRRDEVDLDHELDVDPDDYLGGECIWVSMRYAGMDEDQ